MKDQKAAYASRTFKRDQYAWGLLILFALFFFLATGRWRETDRVELRSWEGPISNRATLTVLEFDRVVFDGNQDHLSKSLLQKELKALDEDGFEAVTINDVVDFFYKGKKLPEKSILLIFANGYLETYSVVDPLLRQMKWPAAVSLITGLVDKRETFFLYWDRLRRMVDSGVWDLVSGGHHSRKVVTNAGNKSTGGFFNRKLWIEKDEREETEPEHSARVLQDYEVSRDLIKENIPGYKILAYFPQYDDFQKYIKIDNSGQSIDRSLKEFFQLGFVDSFVGVNDKKSDPLRLRRLRVQPDWKPKTLLAMVNKAIQATAVSGPDATRKDTIWFTGKGELVETSGTSNILSGKELCLVRNRNPEPGTRLRGTPGTAIFKPGGSRADNWTLKANIRLDRGEFWIRQNSPKGRDEWRLGGNAKNLNVQYRVASGQYENLASSSAGIPLGIWHHLRLIKRGKGIIVHLNDETLWNLPVHLPGGLNGDIAFQVWSGDGEGALKLKNAKVSFSPHDIRWLEKYPQDKDVQRLIKQAEQVSGVTTVTHVIQGNQWEAVDFDKDLFEIIAHRYGWDFIPTVRLLPKKKTSTKSEYEGAGKIEGGSSGDFWMSGIQTLVKHNHWTHVHLDLTQWASEVQPEWFSSLSELKAELDNLGCQLLVTTEGRPDIRQPIKSHQLLKERIPGSRWALAGASDNPL